MFGPVPGSVLRAVLASMLVSLLAPAAGVAQAAGPDGVRAVSWLAGCWEGTLSSGATYEEVWLPPRGGTMIGMARMTRDGRTLSWELLRIETDEDGRIVYAAVPSGQALTRFGAVAVSDTAAAFENPEHDFPQRVLYRLTPPDGLEARIEGERDGQTRSIDFPLRRTACPG